jgi:hypothetical protein
VTRLHPRVLSAAQRRLVRVLGPWATARGFYLAGGTALGLYLGHRESRDFDWFGPKDVEASVFVEEIEALTGRKVQTQLGQEDTLLGRIEGVSFSLFRYPYRLLGPLAEWSGTALASLSDLAAMKLAAVADRNKRRDFVDVYFLMRRFAPLADLIALFQKKYPRVSVLHLVRSLGYFEEADTERALRLLQTVRWTEVKQAIRDALSGLVIMER